jgi:hypothetical protein
LLFFKFFFVRLMLTFSNKRLPFYRQPLGFRIMFY